jgi:hypothetical protein
LLGDLARQLDDGRIYDRDLLSLSVMLSTVNEAFDRRTRVGRGQPAQSPRPHRRG